MTDALTIREIIDADVEAVVALWRAVGISRPYNNPYGDIAFARRDDHSTVLVGVTGGRVMASAMVGDDGHRGWIYYLATDAAYRSRGYGKMLMAAAETWLQGRNVWKAQLLIRNENIQVREFYERLGYRDTGVACFQKVIGVQPAADAELAQPVAVPS